MGILWTIHWPSCYLDLNELCGGVSQIHIADNEAKYGWGLHTSGMEIHSAAAA